MFVRLVRSRRGGGWALGTLFLLSGCNAVLGVDSPTAREPETAPSSPKLADAGEVTPCPEGEVRCEGQCVSLGDPQHCGACGHHCGGGPCVDSVCGPVSLGDDVGAPRLLEVHGDRVSWVSSVQGAVRGVDTLLSFASKGGPSCDHMAPSCSTSLDGALPADTLANGLAMADDYTFVATQKQVLRVRPDGSQPELVISSEVLDPKLAAFGDGVAFTRRGDDFLFWQRGVAPVGQLLGSFLTGDATGVVPQSVLLLADRALVAGTFGAYGGRVLSVPVPNGCTSARCATEVDLGGQGILAMAVQGDDLFLRTSGQILRWDLGCTGNQCEPVLMVQNIQGRGAVGFRVLADARHVYWVAEGRMLRKPLHGDVRGEAEEVLRDARELNAIAADEDFLYLAYLSATKVGRGWVRKLRKPL